MLMYRYANMGQLRDGFIEINNNLFFSKQLWLCVTTTTIKRRQKEGLNLYKQKRKMKESQNVLLDFQD